MAMAAAAIRVPVMYPLKSFHTAICVGISLIHLQRFVGARL